MKESKSIYKVIAKDGKEQKFNVYIRKSTGKYVVRFFVDNYGHKQWNGTGCSSFREESEARSFGYKIASSVRNTGDYIDIKYLVQLYSSYKWRFQEFV